MQLSLIIPAHNEERYIEACLRSIDASRPSWLTEVIVVDNASTDRTADVAARFPGVKVVREERKGVTCARQRGFDVSTGDVLAFVDADSYVDAAWFATLERELTRHADTAGLSGPCRYTGLPWWKDALVWFYWNALAFPVYLVIRSMVLGGNFAVRRKALAAIGGFDTSIAFYGEDTNIARRLRAAGRVRFSPRFCIVTSPRRFTGEGMVRTAYRYVLNFLSELLLHRPITKQYRDIR